MVIGVENSSVSNLSIKYTHFTTLYYLTHTLCYYIKIKKTTI